MQGLVHFFMLMLGDSHQFKRFAPGENVEATGFWLPGDKGLVAFRGGGAGRNHHQGESETESVDALTASSWSHSLVV